VLDIKKINECYKEIINDFNRIDILINAAGGNIKEATTSEELSFFDLPLPSLEKVVGLNLFGGSILPCQVFGKHMVKNKEGGSIINISSLDTQPQKLRLAISPSGWQITLPRNIIKN